ncbi:hypothetical protein L6R52_19325 [Myxococcota bacterium]|nr:hypothetical protein [Myxococcota bacterium]
MATRKKGTKRPKAGARVGAASKVKRAAPSDTEHGRVLLLLEHLDGQMRLLAEGLVGMEQRFSAELRTFRDETRERFTVLETVVRGHSVTLQQHTELLRENGEDIRRNSEDIRKNSEDIRGLQAAVARIEANMATKGELAALDARVCRLEEQRPTGT